MTKSKKAVRRKARKSDRYAEIGREARSLLMKWILVPSLGALASTFILGRAIDWVTGPASYKIYVGGNLDDPDGLQIAQAFAGDLPPIDGVKVKIKEFNDHGDPDEAERISRRLASEEDTLLVVGHFKSSTTQRALPAYLQSADPPIPVVLTTETNPNLVPKTEVGAYQPVFRLSPTDSDQAKKAAEFVLRSGPVKIGVVEDVSNRTYSQYLASEFVRQIEQKGKVVLRSNNYNMPSAQYIHALGVNWVFFAGDWQGALVLIRQLRAMPETRHVNVLLSDSCVNQALLTDGGNDLDQVYLTHPLPPTVYNGQGYAAYGAEAFAVVHQLLSGADGQFDQLAKRDSELEYTVHWLLGLHRVSDARRVVAHLMESAADPNQVFNLSSTTQASFNWDGTRRDAAFSVWQIRNGKFSDGFSGSSEEEHLAGLEHHPSGHARAGKQVAQSTLGGM